MKGFMLIVLFLALFDSVQSLKCRLYEGVWESKSGNLSNHTISQAFVNFSRVNYDVSNCTDEDMKDCERHLGEALLTFRKDFVSLDRVGMKYSDRYCAAFNAKGMKGLRIGTFIKIEDCTIPEKFIGLIYEKEFCCNEDSKFGC